MNIGGQSHSSGQEATLSSHDSVDSFGRRLDYLRISVTDRCNLRCVYCMPPEGVAWQDHSSILDFAQISRIVEAAASLGFRRIRLTGGEPLVRKGIVSLVESLAGTAGIEEVAMTSNGTLLAAQAEALAHAGLRRVNISLDTLRAERFRRITRLGEIDRVWQGAHAAEAAGLTPLKLNVVVVRGLNDDEVTDFARLTLDHPWHVRFIEVMPLAGEPDWGPGMPCPEERLVTTAEIQERLTAVGPLLPDVGPGGHGPARYYRLPGAAGTLGFINALSDHFCASCNRMRLTADGWLRPCLFSDRGLYIKPALDAGADVAEIVEMFRQATALKPAGLSLAGSCWVAGTTMSAIGG